MTKRNWLHAQIRAAENDVQRWPDWMKKVASFEGRGREHDSHIAADKEEDNRQSQRSKTPPGMTEKQ
jgi:hypothetical protein